MIIMFIVAGVCALAGVCAGWHMRAEYHRRKSCINEIDEIGFALRIIKREGRGSLTKLDYAMAMVKHINDELDGKVYELINKKEGSYVG